MNKRRIIFLVLLVVLAVGIGIFAVRALPDNSSADETQTTESQANDNGNQPVEQNQQSQDNLPATNGGRTDNSSSSANNTNDESSQLAATGPEDSLLVFITATVLGVGLSHIWQFSRRYRTQ